MLLREGKQREDGRFVISVKNGGRLPFGANPPGGIKYHGGVNKGNSANFDAIGKWTPMKAEGKNLAR